MEDKDIIKGLIGRLLWLMVTLTIGVVVGITFEVNLRGGSAETFFATVWFDTCRFVQMFVATATESI